MLYKYVYGREACWTGAELPKWGKKNRLLCLSLFPWKHTCMQISYMEYLQLKKRSLHDRTVWFKPALSDRQLDSGKIVLCFRHKMLDPASFTKWITSLAFSVNIPNQLSPLTIFAALTLHVLCSLNWRYCNDLSRPCWILTSRLSCEGLLSPPMSYDFVIMVSCYAISTRENWDIAGLFSKLCCGK